MCFPHTALCKLIYGLFTGRACSYERTQITGPYKLAEKGHKIIKNLEWDQYLEAQSYVTCDHANAISMDLTCDHITSLLGLGQDTPC